MRAGVPMAPAIIEDRRRVEASEEAGRPLMIARADGEPPHVTRVAFLAIASRVKVTVEKRWSQHGRWLLRSDLQAGVN
jgi:hypothetical protein